LVNNDEIKLLGNKIDQVNKMTREELKESCRTQILQTEISSQGGSGLGITDISLKSEAKLNYNFHEYDENSKFFTSSIHIKNKEHYGKL
jgi:hypothetical protein